MIHIKEYMIGYRCVMCKSNLVWLDLEMTGLNPEKDCILEIATLVTDSELNVISEGPVCVIHQVESRLLLMDSWNMRIHNTSGLLDQVRDSAVNEFDASNMTINFLKNLVSYKESPMCGNSIAQDRRFLRKYMPELEDYFNYRCLDVSTLRELMYRWRPDLMSGLKLNKVHRALNDIRESVLELIYYKEHFINYRYNLKV